MVETKKDDPKTEEEEVKAMQGEAGEAGEARADGEVQKKKNKKKKKKKGANANQDDVGEDQPEETKDQPQDAKAEQVKKAGDGEDGEAGADGEGEGEPKKKKNKKKKKKKDGAGDDDILAIVLDKREQDNSRFRMLGSWSAGEWKQTNPPTIPVSQQFEKGHFPIGEIQEHHFDFNTHRIGSEELRARERLFESDYDDLRRAAEVHRQTRKHAQKFIKPGMKIMDICNEIEETNRRLIEASGLDAGIAFPTGASINHCAAHWTPNMGDETVLQYDDVMKIDYGSHLKGLMTDCAFTVAFNPTYDNLLQAVKEATDSGIKAAGIDARLCEVGDAVQETMEAYEVEIKGKTYPVKCIQNLCGHSMERFKIHAGKSVPIVRGGPETKMVEGEQYAIETFGSTGKGRVWEDGECSHYMQNFDKP